MPQPLLLLTLTDSVQLLFKLVLHKIPFEALSDFPKAAQDGWLAAPLRAFINLLPQNDDFTNKNGPATREN